MDSRQRIGGFIDGWFTPANTREDKVILNYTTKIDASRTLGEIQAMLAQRGAKEILIQYSNGVPTSLLFSIDIGGEAFLPCQLSV